MACRKKANENLALFDAVLGSTFWNPVHGENGQPGGAFGGPCSYANFQQLPAFEEALRAHPWSVTRSPNGVRVLSKVGPGTNPRRVSADLHEAPRSSRSCKCTGEGQKANVSEDHLRRT